MGGPTGLEEKEQKVYMKQLELDDREQSLNVKEQALFKKERQLMEWHKTIQEEDERAQMNIATATRMHEEVTNLESQVLR